LGESKEFAASLGLLQLQAKQLEEMTNVGDSAANGGEVDELRRGGLRERKFRNEMEIIAARASRMIARVDYYAFGSSLDVVDRGSMTASTRLC
jgi:hypothetical protein